MQRALAWAVRGQVRPNGDVTLPQLENPRGVGTSRYTPVFSWSEAIAILTRENKGLDHLSVDKAAVEGI